MLFRRKRKMDDDEQIFYYDPLRDPVNFLKRPFGTSVREQLRQHLSEISGAMAAITLLVERYPWLLSKEDVDYLNDNWQRIDQIYIRKR